MNQKSRTMLVGSIAVFLLLAVHFARPAPGGLLLRTLYDSLHVPVFGIVAIRVLYMTPANWSGRHRLVAAIAVVVVPSLLREPALTKYPVRSC